GHGLPPPLPIVMGRSPEQLIRNPDRVERELLGSQGEGTNVDPARCRAVDERVPQREDETDLERAHETSAGIRGHRVQARRRGRAQPSDSEGSRQTRLQYRPRSRYEDRNGPWSEAG